MGQLYVAGRTEGALGTPSGGSDPFVAEIHPEGGVEWIHQFGTPAHETVFDLEVSATGDIYLGGDTLGSLARQNQGSSDFFVRKVDPGGDEVWTQQWGHAGYDTVRCLETTSDALFVAGKSSGFLGAGAGQHHDLFIAELDL